MSSRLAAVLALSLALTGVENGEAAQRASVSAAMVKSAPEARDGDQAALSPARERQKRCANEWRSLSAADRIAQGPKWPQFYSRCVKRLKDPKA